MIFPAGTLSLFSRSIAPTLRPASPISRRAWFSDLPTTFGAGTCSGGDSKSRGIR